MGWKWTDEGGGWKTRKTRTEKKLEKELEKLKKQLEAKGGGAAVEKGESGGRKTKGGQTVKLDPIIPQAGPKRGKEVSQRWVPGHTKCASCGSICCRPQAEACFTCGAKLKKTRPHSLPPGWTTERVNKALKEREEKNEVKQPQPQPQSQVASKKSSGGSDSVPSSAVPIQDSDEEMAPASKEGEE